MFHDDWPVSGDYPTFWLELGKTVAAFGYLENELTSACYALTTPPADFSDLQPDQIEAHLKWYAKVDGYRTDAMFALVKRYDELLRKDGRVPHTVRTELYGRLDELRTWRNALCHGAWFGFSGDGAGYLSHYYREGERVVQFPPTVTLQSLADLRGRIVDATIRVVETSSVAGSRSALNVREEPGMFVDMAGLDDESLDWSHAATTTGRGDSPGGAVHFLALTVSRSDFPALNAGVFDAAMEMVSPVAGLRPCRAERARVENVPNPVMATVSSLASASPITENAVEMTVSAVALDTSAWAATWAQSSDLVMRRLPRVAFVRDVDVVPFFSG